MAVEDKKKAAESTPVTVRMPVRLHEMLKLQACAKQTTVSSLIISKLLAQELPSSPATTAMAHIVALRIAVEKTGACAPDTIDKLESLVEQLTQAVHHEMDAII